MRAYRLSRSLYPSYDGEGARRAGGRWNIMLPFDTRLSQVVHWQWFSFSKKV